MHACKSGSKHQTARKISYTQTKRTFESTHHTGIDIDKLRREWLHITSYNCFLLAVTKAYYHGSRMVSCCRSRIKAYIMSICSNAPKGYIVVWLYSFHLGKISFLVNGNRILMMSNKFLA